MKKALSLVLAVILAFACVPVAFAANYNSFDDAVVTLSHGDTIGDATINASTTVVIPQNQTVTIAENAIFVINGVLVNNGTLINNGTMIVNTTVNNSGLITNNGTIRNINNIYCGESGQIQIKITFDDSFKSDPVAHPYQVRIASIPAVGDSEPYATEEEKFFADPEAYYGAANVCGSYYVLYGESIYFTIDFLDLKNGGYDNSIDPDKFVVYGNGVRIYRDRGAYRVTPSGDAITVTYGDFVRKNLIKKIRIALPYGEGYRVVAYGTTLEQATEENIECVYVDYGSSVSFRVDVYEGWDASNMVLTIGGLDPTVQADGASISGPDQFGYYTISQITDTKAAGGVYDIYIAGVVATETQDFVLGIMNTIRRVFETVIDIFKTFFDMFKGLGSSIGGALGGNGDNVVE